MRVRTLVVLFVVGLVAVGVAVAGVNRNWSVHANGRVRGSACVRPTARHRRSSTWRRTATSLDYQLIASNIDNVVPGAHPPRRAGP